MKVVTKMNTSHFPGLLVYAVQAGRAAAAQYKAAGFLRPMTVVGGAPDGKTQEWFVEDGVCGFAWVRFPDARKPFARYLKQIGVASKAYPTGVSIWISDYNQSMQLKAAHAEGMARYLTAQGIECYAESRMD